MQICFPTNVKHVAYTRMNGHSSAFTHPTWVCTSYECENSSPIESYPHCDVFK